jgi:4'-phosphopantetheinyl transferase
MCTVANCFWFSPSAGNYMAFSPPNDDQLNLWFVRFDDLVDAEPWQRWLPLLDPTETERAARFMFEKDRRTYVLSHVLVRTMLSTFANVDPAAWRFETNAHGKPRIVGPVGFEDLRFNLSHTRGGALCGVVQGAEIGVDIETLDRATDHLGLCERYFSTAETAVLRAAPTDRQRELFFRFWTLKEAYIKARGLGLAIPLDAFSYELDMRRPAAPPTISFAAPGAVEKPIDDDPQRWQLAELDCGPGFPAAIAVERGEAGERKILLQRVASLSQP